VLRLAVGVILNLTISTYPFLSFILVRVTPTANRNSCRVARLVGAVTQGSVLRPQPWAGKSQLLQSCRRVRTVPPLGHVCPLKLLQPTPRSAPSTPRQHLPITPLTPSSPRLQLPTTPFTPSSPCVHQHTPTPAPSTPRLHLPTTPPTPSSPHLHLPTTPLTPSYPRLRLPTTPPAPSSPHLLHPTTPLTPSSPRLHLPTTPPTPSSPRLLQHTPRSALSSPCLLQHTHARPIIPSPTSHRMGELGCLIPTKMGMKKMGEMILYI